MGTVGTVHGYGTWVRSVRYMYENRTHVPYPCTVPTVPMYRTRTVPVPYPHPYPHQNPYQPSRTYLFANRPTSKKANRALLLKLAKLYTSFCCHIVETWQDCQVTMNLLLMFFPSVLLSNILTTGGKATETIVDVPSLGTILSLPMIVTFLV